MAFAANQNYWGLFGSYGPLSGIMPTMPANLNAVSGSAATTGGAVTPVPSGDAVGGSRVSGSWINHVTFVVTVAGMIQQIAHGLQNDNGPYAPTAVWAIQQQAEGSTPSAVYGVIRKDNLNITMQFSATGTWDIYYA